MIDVIDRLAAQHERFKRDAFYYVARAIESAHDRIKKKEHRKRHISGRELVQEIVRLARAEFGYLAWTVFREWGWDSTEAIGDVVFIMVDNGILSARESDSPQDFVQVCDLAAVLERDYADFDMA